MIHRFGDYELDESKGELRKDGTPVRMQPKPFELLLLLVRERERVVPQDELFDALWPDTIVTPASLTRAISHARRAIGDTGKGELIRSVARRGYRFCAEVESAERQATPPPAASERGAAAASSAAADPPTRANDDPFVGREAAVTTLMQVWDEVVAGRGRTAIVRGPAGIGKSRLASEFCERARQAGARVLVGRGRAGEGVPPLWIWGQVLRQLARLPQFEDALRPIAAQGEEYAAWLPELSNLIAEARGDGDRLSLSKEQRRFMLFEAANQTLSECSQREPLLILLEDLHWSRSSSIGLFEHVAYEIADRRVLIVATIRDEAEQSNELRRALASIRGADPPVELPLEGFTRAEVADLLGEALGNRPPSELSSEVYARTEGVPLFVREAIRLLTARGDLADPDSLPRRGVTLPMHSIELIDRSLEALPTDVADTVSAGAVLGRDFSVPLVAGVTETPRETVLEHVDRAIEGGILEPAPERAGRFRFRHALFRDAAYQRLGTTDRPRLHYRVAARLENQLEGDPDSVLPELAHHLHESLVLGDADRALEIAERAASHARALAADDQVTTHLEQALAALDHVEVADAGHRLRLLTELAEAYGFSGDRDRRRDTARRAMDLAGPRERAQDFARAAIAFCEISEWSPDDPEAEQALHKALEMLGDDHGVERAKVLVRLAYLVARVKTSEVEERGRQALAAARKTGDSDTIQEALFTYMYILAGPDRLSDRAELAGELSELAPASGDRDPALVALIDSACDAIAEGDAQAAADRRHRAGALCGRRPHQAMAWHLAVYDAGLALMEGRIDDGEAGAEHAAEIGRRISHPFANACWIGHLAEAQRWRGRLAEALGRLERGISNVAGPSAWLCGFAGRSRLALGESARARELLDQLAVDDFLAIPRGIRWLNSMVETAHLCAELGDEERARLLIPLLEPVGHLHGVFCIPINYGGPVSGALSALHALLGDRDRAIELGRVAVQSLVTVGARPLEMRHRRDLAHHLESAGEIQEATDHRLQADRIASELGIVDGLRSLPSD